MISENNKTVLLITNIPTPYRIPLFNELNKQLNNLDIRLKVLFGALGYPRRKWEINMSECQFEYEVLPSRKIPILRSERIFFTYRGIHSKVINEKPVAIISIGFSFATLKLWLMSFFSLPSYYIWTGSFDINGRTYSYLRTLQRKLLAKKASGFITYGTKAKDYLVKLGVNPDKIQISYNTTDIDYFKYETQRIRKAIRREKGIKRLLYIGYINSKKRLDLLFLAIKGLLKERQDFVLHVVGAGPEMEKMKTLSHKLGIENYVKFEGYKQKEDIPAYLAQADCFLFPTDHDIWGLVLVEAMSAGLPCISSIYAGATHDLIVEGVTGFAVDFAYPEEVAKRVNWILDNPKLSNEIGRNASRLVAGKLRLEESAKSFVKIIQEL